jgi:hypothetical protein
MYTIDNTIPCWNNGMVYDQAIHIPKDTITFNLKMIATKGNQMDSEIVVRHFTIDKNAKPVIFQGPQSTAIRPIYEGPDTMMRMNSISSPGGSHSPSSSQCFSSQYTRNVKPGESAAIMLSEDEDQSSDEDAL